VKICNKSAASSETPDDTQVLVALQFYSSGSFQWMLGRGAGLSQASLGRVKSTA